MTAAGLVGAVVQGVKMMIEIDAADRCSMDVTSFLPDLLCALKKKL